MEKKLTAQGPKDRKSYTVTLPIEWVKKENLDKIRSVELGVVGNKIIISPYKEIEERIFINGEDYANTIIKVLQGLYRIGINEIKLSFTNNKLVDEVIDIIEKKTIGYEIVEQKKDYVIIKDITKESEEEFKVIFRRIFLLLLELAESKDITQINSLNRNIKKLINYCQRILMKKGHVEFTKTPLYYLVLDRLEKLKDEYKWLLEIIIKKKKKNPILEDINKILRVAYELFYNYDPKIYNVYEYKTYQLKNEIKFGKKIDKEDIHLHNLTRILNSLYADIFALKFNEK